MTPRRGRVLLLGLVGVFALPVLVAYGLYYGAGWRGDGQAAAGHLLRPMVAVADRLPGIDTSGFEGYWSLVVVGEGGCDTPCRQALADAHRVRSLLHVKAARVRTVLLIGDNIAQSVPNGLQPDVHVYRTDVHDWQSLFMTHDAARPGTIQLIDPGGRWMAYYPPSIAADGLYHDIRRLLSVADPGPVRSGAIRE